MNSSTKLLSLLAAGLAVGCVSQRDLGPADMEGMDLQAPQAEVMIEDQRDTRDLVGQLPVRNGELDGSIGEVNGLERNDSTDVSGWGEPYYASVYTVGWGSNGAAMTILELEGGLGHEDLYPGAHYEFDLYDSDPEATLNAYVVGCSGPQENEWEFDQVADETTIDVSEDPARPDVMIIDYTGRFTDWETMERSFVSGRFEVER
jgi:hypothetical protein